MANPRQRRKARSGKGKTVLSQRGNKKQKKVTPRNIPGVLDGSYMRRATPRQNYERLGLLSGKLGPRLAGGIEKKTDLQNGWLARCKKTDEFQLLARPDNEQDDDDEDDDDDDGQDSQHSAPDPAHDAPQKLAKGEGRIVRDPAGNIVKVIIGDEAPIELLPTSDSHDSAKLLLPRQQPPACTTTPWGAPLPLPSYDLPPPSAAPAHPPAQGIAYDNPRQGCVAPKTDFVQALETLSRERTRTYAESMAQKRHLSAHQTAWLERLVRKHGDNTAAMARDLRLNRDQKTAGEIRRLIALLPIP